jgi:membrane-associated phospholipid phosphatase
MAWGRGRQVTASRPPRPLLAAGHRRAAAVVVAVCVAVVAALAIRYAGHTQAGPFDASVDRWFQSQLGLTSPPLTALTWLGDPLSVTIITALIALGCARARWWRGIALAVLAVPAASGLTEGILKPLIGRTIDGELSLPSGHTTAVFSMATLGAVLLASTPASTSASRPARASAQARDYRDRRLITLAAYVLATAVAVAMVAQGFHYFTDTIAGVGVGVGTVLLAALLIDAVAGRRARRGPAEATMAACPAASPPSSSTPSTRN